MPPLTDVQSSAKIQKQYSDPSILFKLNRVSLMSSQFVLFFVLIYNSLPYLSLHLPIFWIILSISIVSFIIFEHCFSCFNFSASFSSSLSLSASSSMFFLVVKVTFEYNYSFSSFVFSASSTSASRSLIFCRKVYSSFWCWSYRVTISFGWSGLKVL